MPKREPVSKKTRFEVFKRDKFTCQYCGAQAPSVVLHVDHINPVAAGGKSEVINLVTACAACNGGKGARKLDDASVVERQRGEIEELESRREQLEMLLAWRDAAVQAQADDVDVLSRRLLSRGGFEPNESGRADLRRMLREYSLAEMLAALDEALDVYLQFVGDAPTASSWNKAFSKIRGICNTRRLAKDRPYLPRLFYVQGILRRRFDDPDGLYVDALERYITEGGTTVDKLEGVAKRSDSWPGFCASVYDLITKAREEEEEVIDLYLSATDLSEGE